MALDRTRLACFATLPDGYGFEKTVAAAARAGFEEFAIWVMSVEQAREELGSLEAVRDCLDRHGIHASVLELVHAWAAADAETVAEERAVLGAVAEILDPEVILAAPLVPELGPDAIEHLRTHCRAFAPRKVALEFLPFTAVPDLAAALHIIEQVGEDNLGLVFDSWHFARSGADYELLASVPADLFSFIQLNDAAVEVPEDIVTETMTARLKPGEGVVDWPRLINILDRKNPDCPIGSEQYSLAVKAMDPDAACRYLFESVQAIIADPTSEPG